MLKRFVLLLPLAAFAADPSGFHVWKSAELKNYEKKLSQKVDEKKLSGQSLGQYGNHTTSMSHREGNGEAEVHEHVNDFFHIQSGEATLILGGKVASPKTTAPGEIRGPSIDGGTKHTVSAGDMVHIDAGVPHQFMVEAGKQITYFVVKVNSK